MLYSTHLYLPCIICTQITFIQDVIQDVAMQYAKSACHNQSIIYHLIHSSIAIHSYTADAFIWLIYRKLQAACTGSNREAYLWFILQRKVEFQVKIIFKILVYNEELLPQLMITIQKYSCVVFGISWGEFVFFCLKQDWCYSNRM